MKLHLGVIDVPYSSLNLPGVGKGGETTGDVAEILEAKYNVIETFWELHAQEGADALAEGMRGTLESLLMGAPPTQNPFGSGESAIDDMFRKCLDSKELEAIGIPGVATQAAKDGVNHRMKHSHANRPARPSFIDTGLLQSSFKSWVD